ncbi:hypothetical protein [Streptomyces sp. NPDC004291]
MYDHRGHLDTGTVLDALLAAYQSGLHTAVSAVLDTEAGLAEIVPPETMCSFPEVAQAPAGSDAPKAETGENRASSDGEDGSPLARVVSLLQEEVLHLASLTSRCDRFAAPPGITTTPSAALESVHVILADIKTALLAQKITKERASLKFRLAEKALQQQSTLWTVEYGRTQSADAYSMVELFTERRHVLHALHAQVVKLFEDVNECLLQFN